MDNIYVAHCDWCGRAVGLRYFDSKANFFCSPACKELAHDAMQKNQQKWEDDDEAPRGD